MGKGNSGTKKDRKKRLEGPGPKKKAKGSLAHERRGKGPHVDGRK